MNKIYLKRAFSIVLSMMVVLTFTVMTTGQADAKSKKKTVWQIVDITSTDNYSGNNSTSTTHYTYDKRGLLATTIQKSDDYNVRIVYDRNRKGAVTENTCSKNGELSQVSRNTVNKKGLVTVSKTYTVDNGKETLYSITKYKYHKNGIVSKEIQTFPDSPKMKFVTTYWKSGKTKTSYTTSSYGTYKYKYNKKGWERKATYTELGGKGTIKWKYKYDKKGNPVKVVIRDKFKDKNGKKITTVRKVTYKYKYDKHKNIIKMSSTSKSNQEKKTDKTTATYKYKKFKVARKYMKYIDTTMF